MKGKELGQMNEKELGQLFPILLVEHNTDWINIYQKEKNKIEKIIVNNIIRIDHIGSTAIPELISKPTIDILLQIKANTDTDTMINDLVMIGYHYIKKPENPPPHIMMVKGYSKQGFIGQAFHLHIRYEGDWDEIYFRDYLTNNHEAKNEYASLKNKLAKKFKHDREEYTKAKTEFITKITSVARNIS